MDQPEILHTRYARALIDFAYSKGLQDDIEGDLKQMMDILGNNRGLSEILIHPEIGLDDKSNLLDRICTQAKLCDGFKDFMLLLLRENRFRLLHGIFLKYRDLYDEGNGQMRVRVKSAFRLDDAQRQNLREALGLRFKKGIILKESICPELIAGVSILAGDRIFDNSLSKNLQLLNQAIKKHEN